MARGQSSQSAQGQAQKLLFGRNRSGSKRVHWRETPIDLLVRCREFEASYDIVLWFEETIGHQQHWRLIAFQEEGWGDSSQAWTALDWLIASGKYPELSELERQEIEMEVSADQVKHWAEARHPAQRFLFR